MRLTPGALGVLLAVLLVLPAGAQRARRQPARTNPATPRLAILDAEDRRAPAPRDLAVIRAGARSADAQTARIALRALGRLERPELIADIVPGLRNQWPELRAEAANALAQAARGWTHHPPSKTPRATLDVAAAALTARLTVEADMTVRAAIAGALGRLPYASDEQLDKTERTLIALLDPRESAADRLGVAGGLEALIRTRRNLSVPAAGSDNTRPDSISASASDEDPRPASPGAVEALRALAVLSNAPPRGAVELTSRPAVRPPLADPARDARVRRLALDALTTAEAVDDDVVRGALADPDAQVRRLTMRAIGTVRAVSAAAAVDALRQGLADGAALVRLEALMASRKRKAMDLCAVAIGAARDPDPHVALTALDVLAECPSAEAVGLLERTANDSSAASLPRGWHRAAHAIVSLATAARPQASAALPTFIGSRVWQLRMYGARAAAVLKDRTALERLASDQDANVRESAIEGLAEIAGHGADAIYIEALGRGGYQVIRVAARALAGTRAPEAPAALRAALGRLAVDGRDNSLDARTAIADTLRGLGVPADAAVTGARTPATPSLRAGDLRLLASARARVAVRSVGSFDLALIGAEAPATVLRFAKLAESGYYNGLTFHRVVPNFVIQGGSPGANEYIGDATFMRDELGQWPHVRGAVGISTRGRDTGDAQIFIDLVDNPRLDHEFTVFAHVLNGMEVVDAILEGDVIEKVEILK